MANHRKSQWLSMLASVRSEWGRVSDIAAMLQVPLRRRRHPLSPRSAAPPREHPCLCRLLLRFPQSIQRRSSRESLSAFCSCLNWDRRNITSYLLGPDTSVRTWHHEGTRRCWARRAYARCHGMTLIDERAGRRRARPPLRRPCPDPKPAACRRRSSRCFCSMAVGCGPSRRLIR